MCLAVPGKVIDIWGQDATRMAKVDFGGVQKTVCLEFVPDIVVGDYTVVHVGFALQRLDEQSALETLALFRELGELEQEFGDAWDRAAREAGAVPPVEHDADRHPFETEHADTRQEGLAS